MGNKGIRRIRSKLAFLEGIPTGGQTSGWCTPFHHGER